MKETEKIKMKHQSSKATNYENLLIGAEGRETTLAEMTSSLERPGQFMQILNIFFGTFFTSRSMLVQILAEAVFTCTYLMMNPPSSC